MGPLRDALSANGRRAPPLSLREGNTARGAGCQVRPARRPPAGAAAAGGKRVVVVVFFFLLSLNPSPRPPTPTFFFFRLTFFFFFFFSRSRREDGSGSVGSRDFVRGDTAAASVASPPPHLAPREAHGADERPRRTPAAAGELRRPEPERAGTGCPAAAAEEVTPLWEPPEAGGTAAPSRPSRRRERSARGARPEGRALRRAPR